MSFTDTVLFNPCNNAVKEILLLSSSTDKEVKRFAQVTKRVNGGDLNVSSLIKGLWSKRHAPHEGQATGNKDTSNSEMGIIRRHVVLREAFVEEVYPSNTLRLIK